ncbi:hypothetical protein MRX96_031548 [Rhipicephalus microplus]
MESTASAGDVQNNAADSRTMDVQHDHDKSPATTESEEGWHTVYYGRRRKPGHESVRDTDGVHCANNKKSQYERSPLILARCGGSLRRIAADPATRSKRDTT